MSRCIPIVLACTVLAIVLLPGCAAPSSSTAFLGDTRELTAHSQFEGALVYRHPAKSAKDYPEVWLDTIEVHFALPSGASEADPQATQEFIAFWRSEVEKHLVKSRNFRLASGAGPGILRMRLALTGVQPAKDNQLFTASAMPGRLDLGSATLEAEALDSQTGERIFALIDQSSTRRPVTADRLEYAKAAIKEWTDRLFAGR